MKIYKNYLRSIIGEEHISSLSISTIKNNQIQWLNIRESHLQVPPKLKIKKSQFVSYSLYTYVQLLLNL